MKPRTKFAWLAVAQLGNGWLAAEMRLWPIFYTALICGAISLLAAVLVVFWKEDVNND